MRRRAARSKARWRPDQGRRDRSGRRLATRPAPWAGRATGLILGACLTLCASSGCQRSEPPFVWARELTYAREVTTSTIQKRDRILVYIQDQPSLSGEFEVAETGDYLHPTVGQVRVAGLSPDEVARGLAVRMKNILVNPVITVRITRPASIRIDIVGEVRSPGTFDLARDTTLLSALARAGWFTDFARTDRIFVIRREPSPDIPAMRRIRFKLSELTQPDPDVVRFTLRDRDLVLVE